MTSVVTSSVCRALHRNAEPVTAPWHGFDERAAGRMVAQDPAQARDRLFEAVVAHRNVSPPGLQQVVLGDDLPGSRHEQKEHIELALGDRDRFPGNGQTTSGSIELEGLENEPRAGRHG